MLRRWKMTSKVKNVEKDLKKSSIDQRTDSKQSGPDTRVVEKNQKKQDKKRPFINCFGIEIK